MVVSPYTIHLTCLDVAVPQTLVATDVLSEGIDVPDCSVVIVYDDLKDATTFVQMRGRARKRSGGGSSFIVMVPNAEQEECVKKLEAEAEMFHNDTFLAVEPTKVRPLTPSRSVI